MSILKALPGTEGHQGLNQTCATAFKLSVLTNASIRDGLQEALEVGATCLLLDEDTCATNFMMRDARMQVCLLV